MVFIVTGAVDCYVKDHQSCNISIKKLPLEFILFCNKKSVNSHVNTSPFLLPLYNNNKTNKKLVRVSLFLYYTTLLVVVRTHSNFCADVPI